MKNGKYTAEDIDEKVLRYVDAYIEYGGEVEHLGMRTKSWTKKG